MTPVAARRAPVTVRTEGAAVVLELSLALDRQVGRVLVDAVASAVATEPDRIDIDLTGLTEWSEAGASALVECREMCRGLPEGLHYRTGRGPGRDALLAAYA
jgi:anti-anti-sigma regulatory factor